MFQRDVTKMLKTELKGYNIFEYRYRYNITLFLEFRK